MTPLLNLADAELAQLIATGSFGPLTWQEALTNVKRFTDCGIRPLRFAHYVTPASEASV
jgi:hypothetical protein